jgi:CspA family cold shock protein
MRPRTTTIVECVERQPWVASALTHFRANRTSDSTWFSVCLAQLPDLGRSQVISQNSGQQHRAVRPIAYASTQRKETTMATGTVKWFNPTKGYGFIQPQGGGKDVFVHISAVERAGLSTLNEGQIVQYEVVSNRGKESADRLKVG